MNFFRFCFGWRVEVFISGHLSTSFAGKKTFHFKWQLRHFIYLLLGYIILYMSDVLLSYFIPSSSNQISLNETIEMIGRQELPYFLLMVCFIGPIAEELIYRGVLMTTFFKTRLGTEMSCFLLLFSVIFISILL